jgi:phytoene desaturase
VGRTDATVTPPGNSSLYVLVPVTHQHPNVDWSKDWGRYRAVAHRQLEKLDITDIEKRIRFDRVVPPAD